MGGLVVTASCRSSPVTIIGARRRTPGYGTDFARVKPGRLRRLCGGRTGRSRRRAPGPARPRRGGGLRGRRRAGRVGAGRVRVPAVVGAGTADGRAAFALVLGRTHRRHGDDRDRGRVARRSPPVPRRCGSRGRAGAGATGSGGAAGRRLGGDARHAFVPCRPTRPRRGAAVSRGVARCPCRPGRSAPSAGCARRRVPARRRPPRRRRARSPPSRAPRPRPDRLDRRSALRRPVPPRPGPAATASALVRTRPRRPRVPRRAGRDDAAAGGLLRSPFRLVAPCPRPRHPPAFAGVTVAVRSRLAVAASRCGRRRRVAAVRLRPPARS